MVSFSFGEGETNCSQGTTNGLLKVLSSSGITGTKFTSLYTFPAQKRPAFGNQRILNLGVIAELGVIACVT